MGKKTPEEIAALKAKYGSDNDAKARAKAAKKEKFGDKNAEQNMAVVDVGIPWTLFWRDGADGKFYKKDVDADKEPWKSSVESAEYSWRCEPVFGDLIDWSKKRTEPCRVRITRFDSGEEETLRRLYGQDIVFIDRTKR